MLCDPVEGRVRQLNVFGMGPGVGGNPFVGFVVGRREYVGCLAGRCPSTGDWFRRSVPDGSARAGCRGVGMEGLDRVMDNVLVFRWRGYGES